MRNYNFSYIHLTRQKMYIKNNKRGFIRETSETKLFKENFYCHSAEFILLIILSHTMHILLYAIKII